jgi:hypothetical protein
VASGGVLRGHLGFAVLPSRGQECTKLMEPEMKQVKEIDLAGGMGCDIG